jgi:hypothetical protein
VVVRQSVLVLLSRSVDYAGLFPPARLPMEQAVRAYAGHLAAPERWLLARFVCPVGRLGELLAAGSALPEGPPLIVAALGTGGADGDAFIGALRNDNDAILRFLEAGAGRMVVDQFEVKLPPPLASEPNAGEVERLAGAASDTLLAGRSMLVAIEAPLAGSPPASVAVVAEGLARANAARQGPGNRPACLKVRCGGAEAAAFPSVEELAGAIAAARDHGVLMKATQGLHRPFRHFDDALGTAAHGFVNLMAAGALARAHDLPAERVAAILGDEEPAHFVFSEQGLSWQGLSLSLAEIASGRRYGVASFGSCSFDEPLEGLRSSGVLG